MYISGNVSVLCVIDDVRGVTLLYDVVYIVFSQSSTIVRFSATTHQRLRNIDIKGLKAPWDIVACERTGQVYVGDLACVWRVSSDGRDIKHWLPKSSSGTFKPWTLSVTSTRLLVTSHETHQLIQFDAVGYELRRVHLLTMSLPPWHAVESPTGTFIVSLYNEQLKQGQVVEVNTGGEVLRQFSGSRLPSVDFTQRVAVDSHGNILVADHNNRRILLLDAHLFLRRVIIDEHQLLKQPRRLCYRERSGRLLVALKHGVAVFGVLCR